MNLTAAEYRRAQPRNLPSVPEAFGVLVSVDALRNPISIERLQGPIVMITAVTFSTMAEIFELNYVSLDRLIYSLHYGTEI